MSTRDVAVLGLTGTAGDLGVLGIFQRLFEGFPIFLVFRRNVEGE